MSLEIRRLSKETKEEQQNIKDYIQAVLKRTCYKGLKQTK